MAKILVVDDNEAMLKVMVSILERSHHEVTAFLDGRAALNHLKGGSPDLLITDLIMPEVEGVELIQKVRRSDPKLPILSVSGGGRGHSELYLKLACQFGANAVLPKPFSAAALTEIVARLLGRPAAAAA
jgi:CheY-like chemotaxis protein